MLGDQLTNMEKFARMEVARRLEFTTFTEEELIEALNILLGDPKYDSKLTHSTFQNAMTMLFEFH